MLELGLDGSGAHGFYKGRPYNPFTERAFIFDTVENTCIGTIRVVLKHHARKMPCMFDFDRRYNIVRESVLRPEDRVLAINAGKLEGTDRCQE